MRKKTRAKAKAKPKAKSSSLSKFWPGLLVGGVIAAAAVHFGPGWFKDPSSGKEPEGNPAAPSSAARSTASPKEKSAAPVNPKSGPPPPSPSQAKAGPPPQPAPPVLPKSPGGLPFFRDPARAAYLLTRMNMGESYPGSLLWKKSDSLGWNAFGVLATSGSPVSTAGAAGNTVTCLLESKRADRVESLRLTANLYTRQNEAATMARFKSLAQAVLQESGCPATRQFLDAIDGTLGLQTDSPEARFTLAQSPLAPGTRWELVVQPR